MQLENLSPLTQILLVFGGLVILFLAVIANNNRNKTKRKPRSTRAFKERLKAKRAEKEKENA
ncbi:hypothetical protein [Mesonia sp. HuA40]|uniref:hypothetical protein n=1 Tax=Mesonia sp. HuA40 TaxID=2602761 RepID=UPI0011CA82C7|nr:hypothetical protein [Mesonia sp. HuA40]TXK73524.1 hypothetical protein FT993_04215 [Mesonia sp. HuA40]